MDKQVQVTKSRVACADSCFRNVSIAASSARTLATCYDRCTFSERDTSMTFSMYSASVPVFTQILGSLSAIIDKAEAHAAEKKIDPAALLQARLYPDMFAFARQIQV